MLLLCFDQKTVINSAWKNLILPVLCLQLEEVMETETYKNAKLILERFDPEAKKKAVSDDICFCFTLCLFSVTFYCIFVLLFSFAVTV